MMALVPAVHSGLRARSASMRTCWRNMVTSPKYDLQVTVAVSVNQLLTHSRGMYVRCCVIHDLQTADGLHGIDIVRRILCVDGIQRGTRLQALDLKYAPPLYEDLDEAGNTVDVYLGNVRQDGVNARRSVIGILQVVLGVWVEHLLVKGPVKPTFYDDGPRARTRRKGKLGYRTCSPC